MNKRCKIFSFLIILFTSIFISNCGPEPIEPIKKVDIGFLPLGKVKDYVFFKPGTWWVYKNTRTGVLDTQVVTFSLLDTLEQDGARWHFTNELFDVESKSLTTGYRYAFYMRSLSAEVLDFQWLCASIRTFKPL
jgi:hypothetical protein